jgi:hypothetical protein
VLTKCVTCGRITGQPTWHWCESCNAKRKAREMVARLASIPTTPTTTTATVTAPPQGPLTRVCPTCQHRPSRDPRPGSKRGECLPCLQARSRR